MEIIQYNKKIQNELDINLNNYRAFTGKHLKYETIVKEYNSNNQLIYEGEYLNGKKNGKGKEYDENGRIKFEGEYVKGKKWYEAYIDNKKFFYGLQKMNLLLSTIQNENNLSTQAPKINICFSTVQGTIIVMKFNLDDTVEQILEKYLLRVNLPELINNIQGKLAFIYSAQSLKFGDKRKINEIFMVGNMNQIFVNDIYIK